MSSLLVSLLVGCCLARLSNSGFSGGSERPLKLSLQRSERRYTIDSQRNASGVLVPIVRGPAGVVRRYRNSPLLNPSLSGYDIPLEGISAEYFCTMNIGSPGLMFTVQVDTGSSLLAVPDITCSTCNSNVGYNASASSTAALVACNSGSCSAGSCFGTSNTCGFSISYGDGASITGTVVVDQVQLGPWTHSSSNGSAVMTVQAPFGSIHVEPRVFQYPPVVGIWGMAYGLNNMQCYPNCITTLLDVFVSQLGMPDVFAMYLLPVPSGVRPAGELVLGGFDAPGPVVYTPIVEETYYIVGLRQMSIDGTIVDDPTIDNEATVVDSGTTLMLVSQTIFTNIQNAFQANYCHLPGVCGTPSIFDKYCINGSSEANLDGFPNITFTFEGARVTLLPKYYMLPEFGYFNGQSNRPIYCLGIMASGSGMRINILGDTFMRAFYIVFDRANTRIGFSELDPGTVEFVPESHNPFWFWPVIVFAAAVAVLLTVVSAMCIYWRRCHRSAQSEGYTLLVNPGLSSIGDD
eukprot:TRINITY_DN31626_c0_g1_i1.p1 TRINITY_DN31626_c0_g1~~TRINITY_DN31626_c0_g1_i1.p1  ORF type:complete len:519 (-),score=145.36 TRINITY_DN31626_c0_g1_i1:353-1909(-)